MAGKFVLEGTTTDSSDGNVMPARVELTLACGYSGATPLATGTSERDHLRLLHGPENPSSPYARAGSLHASVAYGQGTLHNTSIDAVWSGGWWCDLKCEDVFVLSFREQVAGGALSQYMYEGRIELDGRALSGKFKHRFFPRKVGTWRLELTPLSASTAAEEGAGGQPAAASYGASARAATEIVRAVRAVRRVDSL